MGIPVRATETGFFGGCMRKEGEAFEIETKEQFSERWMEKRTPPGRPSKSAAKKSAKQSESSPPNGEGAGDNTNPSNGEGAGDL